MEVGIGICVGNGSGWTVSVGTTTSAFLVGMGWKGVGAVESLN